MCNRRSAWLLIVAGLVTALGCSSGIKIYTESSPEDEELVTDYTSYCWHESEADSIVQAKYPAIATDIIGAVDKELSARGYQKTESGDCDFLISYHAAVEGKMTLTELGSGHQPDQVTGTGYGDSGIFLPRRREYDKGTLALDFVDFQSQKIVWRGVAEGPITPEGNTDQRHTDILEAVQKILDKLPAKKE